MRQSQIGGSDMSAKTEKLLEDIRRTEQTIEERRAAGDTNVEQLIELLQQLKANLLTANESLTQKSQILKG
jgi:hypothetical protein